MRSWLVVLALLVACGRGEEEPRALTDAEFEELQERGRVAMGVDQYTSTHRFDSLADGGRIELQRDLADMESITAIRRHLKDIAVLFAAGDFRIPGFIHDQTVPGSEVMSAKRGRITYRYEDLPNGGEVRLTSDDPEAVAAIHEFMEFQRTDHRAGGHEH